MSIALTTTSPTEVTTNSAVTGGVVTGTDESNFVPLVDLLMESKFQFSNVSRQSIQATIRTPLILKPFQMFIDEKQADKRFLLRSYRYSVLEDTYDIELVEYNNSDVINIVG